MSLSMNFYALPPQALQKVAAGQSALWDVVEDETQYEATLDYFSLDFLHMVAERPEWGLAVLALREPQDDGGIRYSPSEIGQIAAAFQALDTEHMLRAMACKQAMTQNNQDFFLRNCHQVQTLFVRAQTHHLAVIAALM